MQKKKGGGGGGLDNVTSFLSNMKNRKVLIIILQIYILRINFEKI